MFFWAPLAVEVASLPTPALPHLHFRSLDVAVVAAVVAAESAVAD